MCTSTCVQEFFANCLDEKTDEGEWFKGIKQQMKRIIVGRAIQDGRPLDESANDIFLVHIRRLCEALARADTAESAERKFAIKTIWCVHAHMRACRDRARAMIAHVMTAHGHAMCCRRAAGRASEPSALSFNQLAWNELFNTATIESPQSKPG